MLRRTASHSERSQRLEPGPTFTGRGYLPSLMPRYRVEGLRGRLPPNNRQTEGRSRRSRSLIDIHHLAIAYRREAMPQRVNLDGSIGLNFPANVPFSRVAHLIDSRSAACAECYVSERC